LTPKSLLILSPLEMPTHPYASVPQLIAAAEASGCLVEGLDMNLEFHHWLFVRERMEATIRKARLLVQGEGGASSSDSLEAGKTAEILASIDGMGEGFFSALDVTDRRGRGLRLQAVKLAVSLAFCVNGEETVSGVFGNVSPGGADPYSSRSLCDSLKTRRGLLDEFYDSFLPGYFAGKTFLFAGISVPFAWQAEPALRLAASIRRIVPGLPVVLGGSYVGMHLAETRSPELFDYFDAMFVGRGELQVIELHKAALSGPIDFSRIDGSVYMRDGMVCRTPLGKILSLDEIPAPKLTFDRSRYFCTEADHFLRLQLSMGCSWARCAFCNLSGCNLFPRQQASVAEAIRKVRSLLDLDIKRIFFGDDEADPGMLAGFAGAVIKEGLRFEWSVNLRFHPLMDMEWALLLKEAGCSRIFVGLEHFDERILRYINKGTTVKLIDECLYSLAWAGIPVTAYMMVGLPGETCEDAEKSFGELLGRVREGLVDNAIFSVFSITPGSPIAEDPQRYGITKVYPPRGDLKPAIADFEHDGISRSEASALAARFEGIIAEYRRKEG